MWFRVIRNLNVFGVLLLLGRIGIVVSVISVFYKGKKGEVNWNLNF